MRVQKPCGKFEEVRTPCMASKVMGKHPEYLVVHCSLAGENCVDIKVISPNESLRPGVPYMLYPKVESTELPGAEEVKSIIPGKMCMSMKNRQLTIRSSRSPDSMSKTRQAESPARASP